MNEFFDKKTLENSQSFNKSNVNTTHGYLVTQLEEIPEKGEANAFISAKEKKIKELKPSLKVDEVKSLKEINDKNFNDSKKNKKLDFNNTYNSKLNRIQLNNSNIFHDKVN